MAGQRTVYIVTDQGATSGIGDYTNELYRAMSVSPFEVQLLSTHYYPNQHIENAHVLTTRYARTPIEVPFARLANRRVAREFIRSRGGFVHLTGTDYSLVTVASRSICVLHEMYLVVPPFRQGLLAFGKDLAYDATLLSSLRYLRACDELVVPSEYTASQVHSAMRIRPTVIHHGVDNHRFFPRDRTRAREFLGLPRDRRIVLNVSMFGANKNLRTLQRIAERLGPQYLMLKVGSPLVGPRVKWLPRVSDADYPLLFAAADLYLHTSVAEGFGIPLIEAMASGIPVVSPSCATGKEVLGETPLLVENPYDVEEFLTRIECTERADIYQDCVNHSIERSREFGLSEWRDKYQRLYSRVFGDDARST